MNFYAHTLPGQTDRSFWEPLFTPFGTDPETQCQREHCEKCRILAPDHGHLNKVAWWCAHFAYSMFLAGSSESKSAKDWGNLTGLWHDLGKSAPVWQDYLAAKANPHDDDISGKPNTQTAEPGKLLTAPNIQSFIFSLFHL